jgi:hypothetical protein
MRAELAHAWLGFAPDRVVRWCRDAGLHDIETSSVRRRRGAGSASMPDLWIVRGTRPRSE